MAWSDRLLALPWSVPQVSLEDAVGDDMDDMEEPDGFGAFGGGGGGGGYGAPGASAPAQAAQPAPQPAPQPAGGGNGLFGQLDWDSNSGGAAAVVPSGAACGDGFDAVFDEAPQSMSGGGGDGGGGGESFLDPFGSAASAPAPAASGLMASLFDSPAAPAPAPPAARPLGNMIPLQPASSSAPPLQPMSSYGGGGMSSGGLTPMATSTSFGSLQVSLSLPPSGFFSADRFELPAGRPSRQRIATNAPTDLQPLGGRVSSLGSTSSGGSLPPGFGGSLGGFGAPPSAAAAAAGARPIGTGVFGGPQPVMGALMHRLSFGVPRKMSEG